MQRLVLVILLVGSVLGCKNETKKEDTKTVLEFLQQEDAKKESFSKLFLPPNTDLKILENGEPNYVTVEHLLIGFKGSLYGKQDYVERSKEEAHKLAKELFERIKSGEDMKPLIKKYSNDSILDRYQLANKGCPEYRHKEMHLLNILGRGTLEENFGDVSFKLEVGEVGMTEYHPAKGKSGWHIIKRTK